jgi:hypothetical protein
MPEPWLDVTDYEGHMLNYRAGCIFVDTKSNFALEHFLSHRFELLSATSTATTAAADATHTFDFSLCFTPPHGTNTANLLLILRIACAIASLIHHPSFIPFFFCACPACLFLLNIS